jgi:hypothetical protein
MRTQIEADLLIMSKSSYSAVASYYRQGPSLMRERYGYATPPGVMFVQEDRLSSEQASELTRLLTRTDMSCLLSGCSVGGI